MAFKMKGPGLPGFRKTQKHAFYKSKPFEGDGRPSSSPFQHNEHPHAGDSMHARQSREAAKLAEQDFSSNIDVDLDEDATTREKLAKEDAFRTTEEKTRYTKGQIYHARNVDIRNHEKMFRRTMMFGDNPGVKDGKVVNERKFNKFMESAWAKEQEENNMQFAYRDLSGTKTVRTDFDRNVDEASHQLTDTEAMRLGLGNYMDAVTEVVGNKPKEEWTDEEKLKIERLEQEQKEEYYSNIKENLEERGTEKFIAEHGTRGDGPTKEEQEEEGWTKKGIDSRGNPVWRNAKNETWIPDNAWSSSEWGKLRSSELGVDPESEEYWRTGEFKQYGKDIEEHVPEGVVGEQGYMGEKGNIGTVGVTHVYPSGGRNQSYYNYRDESGKMHKKISQQELDKLKLEQPSYIAEQEKKQEEMAKTANAKEQALKQERINLANDHWDIIPDEGDYANNKRGRNKYNKALKKWTEDAENLFGVEGEVEGGAGWDRIEELAHGKE